MPARRAALLQTAALLALPALAAPASAQARVDERDPQALNLGYVGDARRVDAGKQPKYRSGQQCANCALYQGRRTDAWGVCPLFGIRQVAGAGWCRAWAGKGS